jgi:hypothetical protein
VVPVGFRTLAALMGMAVGVVGLEEEEEEVLVVDVVLLPLW